MTFRFSTSWTTLEFDLPNTRARLFFSDGIQFPSDRSDDPVLIKCVFHGGSDMVPWTHVVGTQDGRMLIDLTSEFTLL